MTIGRLSSHVGDDVFLMFLIIVLGGLVVQIPMAALVGVMFMVAFSTFDWGSVRHIYKVPRSDAAVMIVTVATVVFTHNLAIGVFAGVLLSAIFFAAKISKVDVIKEMDQVNAKVIYRT